MRLRPIRTLSSALEQLKGCKVVGIIKKVSKHCDVGREADVYSLGWRRRES